MHELYSVLNQYQACPPPHSQIVKKTKQPNNFFFHIPVLRTCLKSNNVNNRWTVAVTGGTGLVVLVAGLAPGMLTRSCGLTGNSTTWQKHHAYMYFADWTANIAGPGRPARNRSPNWPYTGRRGMGFSYPVTVTRTITKLHTVLRTRSLYVLSIALYPPVGRWIHISL